MQLSKLITGLTARAAYPFTVEDIDVRQTHISVVFLAGAYVYKIKKPVDYGFLDFSTLEKRRHFCNEEVRLNRRLAPDVYLGTVPVTLGNSDPARVCFEGDGEPVEWAVKMRRLPDEATLNYQLARDRVSPEVMRNLGRRIADFHAGAESGPHVDKYGSFDVVAGNARDNFKQSLDQIGTSVSQAVFERIAVLTEAALSQHRELIESRASRGVSRDTHGDLRLDHIYLFPDRDPPGDMVVIDCIEFSEQFRFADPISDTAFLVSSLFMHGYRDLADEFLDAYFQASADDEGQALMSLYTAYRAVVRGKVEGLKLSRDEITAADREVALMKSRGAWLLALGELETPLRRPCLLLVAGLPGTGKSTLARALAEQTGFEVIRSDIVRKELVREINETRGQACYGQGIYTPAWNRRTYEECLRRAEQLLFAGKRVLVDANFRVEADRREFLSAATRLGVRSGLLICTADADVVRERLASRCDDASDADWSVYLRAMESWEKPSQQTQTLVYQIDTGGTSTVAVSKAIEAMQRWQVA